jgi:NADH:ubiquinone oxidoreductase subunit 6 (subunit J)
MGETKKAERALQKQPNVTAVAVALAIACFFSPIFSMQSPSKPFFQMKNQLRNTKIITVHVR